MSATATAVETRERPIIFSGPMVKAILEDRKSQTRRVIKPQPEFNGKTWSWHPKANGETAIITPGDWATSPSMPKYCPYGQPGDRLWVRETFAEREHNTQTVSETTVLYRADGRAEIFSSKGRSASSVDVLGAPDKWKPPIFMPRWASRITLEITDIRVERLHEISETDAIAEGVRLLRDDSGSFAGREGPGNLVTPWLTAKEAFADKWDTINGKRAPWSSNPWCWVLSFRKVTDGR